MRRKSRGSRQRTAFAFWRKQVTPEGSITTESKALREVPFAEISARRANIMVPTELVAAAHAACFSSTLAAELGRAGFQPQTIRTTATVTSVRSLKEWAVSAIALDVVAAVPGAGP